MFRSKKIYKIITYSFVLFFFIAIGFAYNNFNKYFFIIRFPSDIHYHRILLVVLFQLIFWFFSSLAWSSLVQVYTKVNISLRASFMQCNAVAIGKYLPGKVWGMVGRGVGLNFFGLNKKEILTVSFIEQVLLLHSGAVLGGCTFIFTRFRSYSPALMLVVLLTVPLFPFILNLLLSTKINRVLTSKISFSHFEILNYLSIFIRYSLLWVSAGLVFSSIYYFLFGPFDSRLLILLLGACAVGIISGFLAFFSPGGVGVREASIVAFLSTSIPFEKALLLVLVYRLWTTFTDIAGGVASFYLSSITKPAH